MAEHIRFDIDGTISFDWVRIHGELAEIEGTLTRIDVNSEVSKYSA